MHRTEGANNIGNLFVNGPPGTTVEQDWLNAIQEEIAYSIEQAGITLKTAATETRQQLKAAIDTLADTRIAATDLRRKNALINGSMEHAQRGASPDAYFESGSTPANDDDTYILDRWILLSETNNTVDVRQNVDVPTAPGSLRSLQLDVRSINKKFGVLQVIEQKNAQRLIGGTVSLSFQAKVSDVDKLDNIKAMVLSWDGAADTVTSDIVSAWNVEDTTPTLVANWTAENTPTNLGVTAAWAQYSITGISIDTANTKNIGVFIWSDGFCDTVGKFLYITDVQLELGNVVTPFEYRLVGDELALCQRYYCKSYKQGIVPGAASVDGRKNWVCSLLANADSEITINIEYPTSMFTVPTIGTYDAAHTLGKIRVGLTNGVNPSIVEPSEDRSTITGIAGVGNAIKAITFQYTATAEL